MIRKLEFTKMQATGNDFVMIDARSLRMDWKRLAEKICRTHFGVGADGLIIVQNSPRAELRMRVFNADGSEAQICGNGLRCFAKYAIERGLAKGPGLTVETLAGVKQMRAPMSRGKVTYATVNMGRPGFEAQDIPVSLKSSAPILNHELKIADRRLELSFVSMGNPHAVCFVNEDVAGFPLHKIGPLVENNALFPQRTNFEIANVRDERHMVVRVWERGVGETMACGSGACATAVVARLTRQCSETMDIMLPGGTLTVIWDGSGDVIMNGPVEEVFTGEYML